MNETIEIDFDGALFDGQIVWPMLNAAKRAKSRGAKLVLCTQREGKWLRTALNACKNAGLIFDEIRKTDAPIGWDHGASDLALDAIRSKKDLAPELASYKRAYDSMFKDIKLRSRQVAELREENERLNDIIDNVLRNMEGKQ